MSQSVTVPRTMSTSSATAILLMTEILKSLSAILIKLFETVIGGVCLGLLSLYLQNEGGPVHLFFFLLTLAFLMAMSSCLLPICAFLSFLSIRDPSKTYFVIGGVCLGLLSYYIRIEGGPVQVFFFLLTLAFLMAMSYLFFPYFLFRSFVSIKGPSKTIFGLMSLALLYILYISASLVLMVALQLFWDLLTLFFMHKCLPLCPRLQDELSTDGNK